MPSANGKCKKKMKRQMYSPSGANDAHSPALSTNKLNVKWLIQASRGIMSQLRVVLVH